MQDTSSLIKALGALVAAVVCVLVLNAAIGSQAPENVSGGYNLAKAVGVDAAKDAKPATAPKAAEPAKAEAPKAEAPKAEAPKAEAKPAAKTEAAAAPASASATEFDAAAVAKAVATASAENGAGVWKKCTACHVAKADGPSTVGPNLWGIVGRNVAAREDYAAKYSEPLKAKGGTWGLPELAAFLHNPGSAVTGTKMSFPGIKDPKDLADLLAYLSAQK